MNYELAKHLKDAGFPQVSDWGYRKEGVFERRISYYVDIPSKDDVRIPHLDQLIEACGDEFVGLRNFRRELVRLYDQDKANDFIKEMYGGLSDSEWIADSTRSWTSEEGTGGWMSEHGSTPEEAVAKLWLALHK